MTNAIFARLLAEGLVIEYYEPLPVIKFPLRIFELTSPMCPAQWSGETKAGQSVYVRYRYSMLRLEIDEHVVLSWTRPDETPDESGWDGYLSTEAMKEITSSFIDWQGSTI